MAFAPTKPIVHPSTKTQSLIRTLGRVATKCNHLHRGFAGDAMSRIASQSSLCTMRCTSILLLLLFTPLYAEDLYGFDSAEQIEASTFRCLASSVNFYVASVINASTGSVDSVGIENVRRARDAGIENIQAYLTPCAESSCPSAHQQVANVFATLRQRKISLSQVWVDVSGAEWSCDVTKNRKFIWALVRSIAAYGLPVGIRTAPDRWLTIVGEWRDLSAYYPLWYARLDNREQRYCTDFDSFGGWQKFDVCQYAYGNYYECGVRHTWGYDYWPGGGSISPTTPRHTTSTLGATSTTSTTQRPTTTTRSTSASTSTSTTTTTTTTTEEPTTTSTTTTTTTTTPTTTPTTQPSTTTKKCRLWIFC